MPGTAPAPALLRAATGAPPRVGRAPRAGAPLATTPRGLLGTAALGLVAARPPPTTIAAGGLDEENATPALSARTHPRAGACTAPLLNRAVLTPRPRHATAHPGARAPRARARRIAALQRPRPPRILLQQPTADPRGLPPIPRPRPHHRGGMVAVGTPPAVPVRCFYALMPSWTTTPHRPPTGMRPPVAAPRTSWPRLPRPSTPLPSTRPPHPPTIRAPTPPRPPAAQSHPPPLGACPPWSLPPAPPRPRCAPPRRPSAALPPHSPPPGT